MFDCSWFETRMDASSCFAAAKSEAWAATSDELEECVCGYIKRRESEARRRRWAL